MPILALLAPLIVFQFAIIVNNRPAKAREALRAEVRPIKEPVCIPYSWGRICVGSRKYVESVCAPEGWALSDKGERVPASDVLACAGKRVVLSEVDAPFSLGRLEDAGPMCRDTAIKHDITVPNSCDGAMILIHELQHADGVADPESAGLEWPETD